MEKEIEILDFVLKDQVKRNIEKGMINSNQIDPLNNKILGEVELKKRTQKNDNRDIFHELDSTNRVYKQNIRKEQQQKKSLIKVYSGIAITTFALIVGGAVKYENSPIKITVREMASDGGVYLTDNGKKYDGKMTQEELVEYAIENRLTMEQLDKEIEKFCNKESLDEETVRESMEETNEEVFNRIR